MAKTAEQQATKYQYDLHWSTHSGWHCSFGDKRMWEGRGKYIVARLVSNENGEGYVEHEFFLHMSAALDYMRTGRR